jgi:hypothetical protein
VTQAITAGQPVPQTIPLVETPSGILSGTLEMTRAIGSGGQDDLLLNLVTGAIPVDGGRMVVRLQSGGETGVVLRRWPSGSMVIESDAPAPGQSDTRIDMHVSPGLLDLQVSGPAGLVYQVSVTFTPATDPGQPVLGDQTGEFAPIVAGDFNGDGIPDLATPAGVNLGIGDGTFQPIPASALVTPGGDPSSMISGDFNGDSHADIAVADAASKDISIFSGRGDGTFEGPMTVPVAATPVALAAGDFDEDGRPEVAVVEQNPGEIQILRDLGGGVLRPADTLLLAKYGIAGEPRSIAIGVFGGDRRGPIDLAVAYGESDQRQAGGVLVFPGQGDGTFGAPRVIPAGLNPVSVVAADFNGDGMDDLAVADQGDISDYADFSNFAHASVLEKLKQIAANASSLSPADLGGLVILLGRRDGTFAAMPEVSAGFLPQSLLVGDFNGDGNADIVVLHGLSVAASLFLGNGTGTFRQPIQVVPAYPAATVSTGEVFGETAVAADFNGDGREDLAVAGTLSSVVPILLGNGDGGFQGQGPDATGDAPISVAVGDFNGDGIPDLAVVDAFSSDVMILLGQGDGGFVVSSRLATPLFPTSVAVADLNGDGRQDLVVADAGASSVSVYLGNGDGTFVDAGRYPVGLAPASVVVGDFNDDRIPDIAVADAGSDEISVLLGKGEGTFQVGRDYPVGHEPVSIAAADFEGDGRPDLVVADLASNSVAILRNLGDGSFATAVSIPVGSEPDSVAVGDLNGDGIPDVAVTDAASGSVFGSVSVLLGEGKKTSWAPGSLPLLPLPAVPLSVTPHSDPLSVVIADLNGDGIPDLAVTDASDFSSGFIDVLYGKGDGTFSREDHYAEDSLPVSIAAGHFLAGGLPDLVITRIVSNDIEIRINKNGTFDQTAAAAPTSDSAPLAADLQGNGTTDVISLNALGDILWRPILGQGPATIGYGAPTPLNPGRPSRGIALIPARPTPLVASLAVSGDEVDLFVYRAGEFVVVDTLPTPPGSTQVFYADISGVGQSDLIVTNPGDGSITVFGDLFAGSSGTSVTLMGDTGLSDLVAIPGGGPFPEMVASNEATGQIQVFTPEDDFPSDTPRYAAGTGLYDSSSSNENSANGVSSLGEVTALATGQFDPGGPLGLVTITPGSNHFNLLHGLGGGRYGNPIAFDTAGIPLAIGAADFNGDGLTDVAILESGEVEIFLNNGRGGFVEPRGGGPRIPAGFHPTDLGIADLSGAGMPDLIVSNSYGDILIFLGDGHGSFTTPTPPNPQMGLAIDPFGDALAITDQVTDRVTLQQPGSQAATTLADILANLRDPGPPVFADLNGDGIPDLIYADGGGDDVRVYLGEPGGLFQAPIDFAVGTNPAGVTGADLGGSQAPPDLIVANEGSNDVSILIGRGTGTGWTLIPGPRLRVGAGPTATSVVDFRHDGVPDLVVSESLANDVRILPGLGGGFFNDRAPTIIPTGQLPGPPVPVPIGPGPRPKMDIAVPDAGADRITLIDGLTFDTSTLPSEGVTPVALLDENGTLLVANEGDGHLGMLRLDGNGDVVSTEFLTDPDLPHLSALAFLESESTATLLATTAGEDLAFLFTLDNPPPHASGPTSSEGNPIQTQFSGELDTAASFTPTLVSITTLPMATLLLDATLGDFAAPSPATAAPAPIGAGALPVPDKLPGEHQEPGTGTSEEGNSPQPGPGPHQAESSEKFSSLQDLESAFDEVRRLIRGQLAPEGNPQPEAPAVRGYTPSLMELEPADSADHPPEPPSDGSRREGDHVSAIDKAIFLLTNEWNPGHAAGFGRRTPGPSPTDGVRWIKDHHRRAAPSWAIFLPLAAAFVAGRSALHPDRPRGPFEGGRHEARGDERRQSPQVHGSMRQRD